MNDPLVLRHGFSGRHAAALCLLSLGLVTGAPARSETNTVDAGYNIVDVVLDAIPSVTAQARLDFTLNIDKMLYLRVGEGGSHGSNTSGAGPGESATVADVTLNLAPSFSSAGAPLQQGNNQSVAWNGAAPVLLSSAIVKVPVEVRSNAGQVRISGEVTTPLSSGASTIPMSSITLTSDNTDLPAPTVPNAGPGTPVDIATGGAGTGAAPALLTQRTADWSFGFLPSAPIPTSGSYKGTITFTATSL